jgi:hypothetical protein
MSTDLILLAWRLCAVKISLQLFSPGAILCLRLGCFVRCWKGALVNQSLLFASCCFLGAQLLAGPIPTLTATSVSIFTSAGGPLPGQTELIDASGPSFTLHGSGFVPGFGLALLPVGFPVNIGGAAATCCDLFIGNSITGTVTLGGVTTQVNYLGSAGASVPANTVVVLSNSNFDLVFPTTGTGSFTANTCGQFEFPPNCSGAQVANIAISLTGDIGLGFSRFDSESERLGGVGFVAPLPEPSSVSLLLIGLVVAIAPTLYRKPLQR